MIELDGRYREGGGQILRTALALSAATGQAFRIQHIRASRNPPGLKAQHLAGVRAVQALCGGKCEGAEMGATALTFVPGRIEAREVDVPISTAGSLTLLLQALLLPAALAPHPVRLRLEGGTDVPGGPPWDSFVLLLAPLMARIARLEVRLMRRGFYPPGGGRVEIVVTPGGQREPLALAERGTVLRVRGRSMASAQLRERRVAERQAQAAREMLGGLDVAIEESYEESLSAGSALVLEAVTDRGARIGADALGMKRRTAEEVGRMAAASLRTRLDGGCCTDEHLTDQLIPLLALVGGSLRAETISEHTWANVHTTEQFLGPCLEIVEARPSGAEANTGLSARPQGEPHIVRRKT